jgi:prephenate dehydrogenase
MKQIPTVSIVGFGRFGQVLYRLLKNDFAVTLYRRHKIKPDANFTQNTKVAINVKEVYKSDVIFFATPIESFEQVITAHKKYFRDGQLLIDVLSVKLHPMKVLEKHLKGTRVRALLTHPMFGPDSSKEGFTGLPLILDQFTASNDEYNFWKQFFVSKQLRVVEISADTHDKMAASSQGLTHFLGRLLDAYGMKATPIDSLGAKKFLEVKEQVSRDSWQLFNNLQHYNPYTMQMRLRLGKKYDQLYNQLLPKQVHAQYITFGIQGGKGSFNEKAIHHYLEKEGITAYKIKYLYTSEKVLRALHRGQIDFGQFAMHNSIGGIVGESVQAIAKYKFRIVDEFAIIIAHALMIRPDATMKDITTIMTHPQVLAQCRTTLATKYKHLKKISGKGDLVEHATVAKHLHNKKLSKEIATLGGDILAKLYDKNRRYESPRCQGKLHKFPCCE